MRTWEIGFLLWRKKAEILMISITAFELLLGANLSKKVSKERAKLKAF